MGMCIQVASGNSGVVPEADVKKWKYSPRELKMFFEFMVWERKCYSIGEEKWVFPIVIHKKFPELDNFTKEILATNQHTVDFEFQGPGINIINRIIIVLATEMQVPKIQSEMFGIWEMGKGKEKSIAIIQLLPSKEAGIIRIMVGGSTVEATLQKIKIVIEQIFRSTALNFMGNF